MSDLTEAGQPVAPVDPAITDDILAAILADDPIGEEEELIRDLAADDARLRAEIAEWKVYAENRRDEALGLRERLHAADAVVEGLRAELAAEMEISRRWRGTVDSMNLALSNRDAELDAARAELDRVDPLITYGPTLVPSLGERIRHLALRAAGGQEKPTDARTVIPAVLGWSNPDTGPWDTRVYATDQGDSPRWAKPHARVVEQALYEAGAREGDRLVVVVLGDRFSTTTAEDVLR